MSYSPPVDNADFRFSGAPYVLSGAPFADFSFDGLELFFYAPPPNRCVANRGLWQNAAPNGQSIQAPLSNATPVAHWLKSTFDNAAAKDNNKHLVPWGAVAKKQSGVILAYGQPIPYKSTVASGWQSPPHKQVACLVGWDDSIKQRNYENNSRWGTPLIRDAKKDNPIVSVDVFGAIDWQPNGYRHPKQPLSFILNDRYAPPFQGACFQFGQIIPALRAVPINDSCRLAFDKNTPIDEITITPWGFGQNAKDHGINSGYGSDTGPDDPDPDPEKPEPDQPEIKESYLQMNIINVVALPGRIPVELNSFSISLDLDSFSWAFAGVLIGDSSMALVEPTADGMKEIEIDINGFVWRFMIERYSHETVFADERYTINGVSRTQLLAAPYAPLRSKSNGAPLNAKQAIVEELENTGFTIQYPDQNPYQFPDWVMPAGAFSYQNKTPMEVVVSIVKAAGGVVIPAMEDNRLVAQPRYPANPWLWDSTIMDCIIPASMVHRYSAQWQPEAAYNAVFVSGSEIGVAVNVKRKGSAGDLPAPDIIEEMLTDTTVNIERGRNELSKSGAQSIVTLALGLTNTETAPGLVLPGMLVAFQDSRNPAANWRGLCLSCAITGEGATVNQTIEIERHY